MVLKGTLSNSERLLCVEGGTRITGRAGKVSGLRPGVQGRPFVAGVSPARSAPPQLETASASRTSPRSLKRWTLPVAVLGSSGRKSIQRGYL